MFFEQSVISKRQSHVAFIQFEEAGNGRRSEIVAIVDPLLDPESLFYRRTCKYEPEMRLNPALWSGLAWHRSDVFVYLFWRLIQILASFVICFLPDVFSAERITSKTADKKVLSKRIRSQEPQTTSRTSLYLFESKTLVDLQLTFDVYLLP